jgi:hypothetical protein
MSETNEQICQLVMRKPKEHTCKCIPLKCTILRLFTLHVGS